MDPLARFQPAASFAAATDSLPRLSTTRKASNERHLAFVALVLSTMAVDVALDIGTSHTRLATTSRGILFDEPTMVRLTRTPVSPNLGHGA